jgi:hypothetical protein
MVAWSKFVQPVLSIHGCLFLRVKPYRCQTVSLASIFARLMTASITRAIPFDWLVLKVRMGESLSIRLGAMYDLHCHLQRTALSPSLDPMRYSSLRISFPHRSALAVSWCGVLARIDGEALLRRISTVAVRP